MSIDNPNEVPEQWWPYFRKQGMDGLTFRELSRKVDGVAVTTVVRALTGEGQPTRRVTAKIASALGMTEDRFKRVRAEVIGAQHHEPFQLPQRADELTDRERELVTGMVNALLDARSRHAEQPATDTADPTPAARAQGTQDEKTLSHATDVDTGTDPEGQAADAARPNVWRDKPADLSERRSRREAGSSVPSDLTPDDVREQPEDAIAARTRDPRFAPDDPAGYYGTNDIGEESQDPEDHE